MGPEAADANPGSTLHRYPMTIAENTGVTTRGRAKNTPRTSAKSSTISGPRAVARAHSSRKRCRASAGRLFFRAGYLADAYARVRAAGGVCIADEVQTGFGRLGTHFWGFETQGVVPDIVVLGKPIGNGFPLGAVITTSEIARSFDNGMEFFSTFGGNPVACAAGSAVLEVVQSENLQQQARRVGEYLKKSLLALQQKYPLIGDVRGSGLFLGLDLVWIPSHTRPRGARPST